MKSPEKVFVKTPEERGERRTKKQAQRFLIQEILGDLAAFPESERDFIEDNVYTPNNCPDLKRYHKAICDWWQEKYGSDFNIVASRNEILFRKYLSNNLEEVHKLQSDLFRAIQNNDVKRIAELKMEYEEKYPDRLESIETLFGIRDHLLKQKAVYLDYPKEGSKRRLSEEQLQEKRKRFRDLTEYQFLLTHFLLTHGEEREFLEEFWDAAEHIAVKLDMARDLNALRRGQMSQVATYKIMEQIGQRPTLSHPDEDAFSAIDLWSDKDTAIQIKGANLEQPALMSVDEVYFPAIATDTPQSRNLYNSYQMRELQRKNRIFNAKISKLSQRQQRPITGWMMVIPYSKIDFVTGEPDPELVEFFKKKISQNQAETAQE